MDGGNGNGDGEPRKDWGEDVVVTRNWKHLSRCKTTPTSLREVKYAFVRNQLMFSHFNNEITDEELMKS